MRDPAKVPSNGVGAGVRCGSAGRPRLRTSGTRDPGSKVGNEVTTLVPGEVLRHRVGRVRLVIDCVASDTDAMSRTATTAEEPPPRLAT